MRELWTRRQIAQTTGNSVPNVIKVFYILVIFLDFPSTREIYLLSDNSNRVRFGSFGKPLSVVRPTLMRLNASRAVKSSVRPTMFVLRQLSKFNSVICKKNNFFLVSRNSIKRKNIYYYVNTFEIIKFCSQGVM